MILPVKYQVQVLQMLHNGQGHQGMERTTALCRECFLLENYVKGCR